MKINVQHIIIFTALVYAGLYGGVLAFVTIPADNREMLVQWGSFFLTMLTGVASYYWGQSSTRNSGGGDNVDK
jgi:hypothetical protein